MANEKKLDPVALPTYGRQVFEMLFATCGCNVIKDPDARLGPRIEVKSFARGAEIETLAFLEIREEGAFADTVHLEVLDYTPYVDLDGAAGPDPLDGLLLPFPFTANQLAAFMLDGWGYSIQLVYGDLATGPDMARLATFPVRWKKVKEALMGAYKAFRDVEEFIDINGNSKRLCQLLDEKVLRLADAYELAVKEAQRKERVFEPFTQPLEKRPAKETGVGRKAREARETIVKLLYDERISAGHDRVRSSVAELRALVDEARGQWEAAFAAHRKAMVNQLLNPQMADQDAVKSHPAPGVASASNRAEPAQDAPIRSVNRKTPETLQFEGAVHTAMTDVWNNWKFNHATDPTLPEPNKGDMHGAALNMLINSGIKSARKHPTLSMVRDAATAWHKPQPVKVTVSPSVAPPTTTRHAFKGEK